jgi:hypothetical protein
MYELKDWLNAINQSKENLMDENPECINEYAPFVINRCMSGQVDTLMYANELNKHHQLDKKLQFDFYINTVRKKKRFSPWLRKDKIQDLECVKRYYGYSNEKALQALKILSKEQLTFIKQRLEIGGKK